MRKVTIQEFIQFIFNQPLEKEVVMGDPDFPKSCLASQFTQANFPDQKFSCGVTRVFDESGQILWELVDPLFWGRSVLHFVPRQKGKVTYSEIREFLKTKDWAQEFIHE